MHDPRVGRFFAVDPLSDSYPWNSPYAFSENRVTNAVELEGLEAADNVEQSASVNQKDEEPDKGNWSFSPDLNPLNMDLPVMNFSSEFSFNNQSTGIDGNFDSYSSWENYTPKYAFMDHAGKWGMDFEHTSGLIIYGGVLHDKRQRSPNVDGEVFRYGGGGTSITGMVGFQKKYSLNEGSRSFNIKAKAGGFSSFNNISVDLNTSEAQYSSFENSKRSPSGGGFVAMAVLTYEFVIRDHIRVSASINGTFMAGLAHTMVNRTDDSGSSQSGKMSVGYSSLSVGPSIGISLQR